MPDLYDIHHVALGVRDLSAMEAFYREQMGLREVFAFFGECERPLMKDVVRASQVIFSGIMLRDEAQGIMLELIQMKEPEPRPIRLDFQYGDIGVSKVSIGVEDLEAFCRRAGDVVLPPKTIVIPGLGEYSFCFCKDPEGNLVELFQLHGGLGGAPSCLCRIGIAVTDLERSIEFYTSKLGLALILPPHDAFSGQLGELFGLEDARVTSCVLSFDLATARGIELFEARRPRGRSIPFSTRWGDFGYLQVAFSCHDVEGVARELERGGVELLCKRKSTAEEIPEHPGEFVYARDPDGIPIELLYLPP
jgi:catechol 2,3-dioxygenase-like lactoylglutathione lyase family enzyme